MEFLFFLAGAVALVWGVILFVRGGLLGGCMAVLVAGSCFGHPFFNVPAGAMPLTADRVLLVVLLVQYLIYRRLGWTDPTPLAKADVALLGLLALLMVSTVTHDWQGQRGQPMAQLVIFWLMPATIYWIARQAVVSGRAVWSMFGCWAAFGVYLSITAIAEASQSWSLVFPAYIGSPSFKEFFGRARGPFLNPAGLGIFLGLGMCSGLLCWPRLNRAGRLVLVAVIVPIFLWGIYSTLTRSVWMGAAAGLVITVGLSLQRSWRMPVLASGILVSTLAAVTQWERLTVFKRDKNVTAAEMAESAKLRPILAVIAWHMFLDRPLLGCGFGQYPLESRPYLSDRTTELPLEKARPYIQHNAVLALLAEVGLVGAALFVVMLILWARDAWRLLWTAEAPPWARQCGLLMLALLGVYLPNAMFHDTSLIAMVNALMMLIAGLTIGMAQRFATVPVRAMDRLESLNLRRVVGRPV